MQKRWTGRTSRTAGTALRLCLGLGLVFYIVYAPIHLYLEPHSEDTDAWAPTRTAADAASVGQQDHDGDDHHARHPAAQHKLKVMQPTRAPVAEMAAVQPVQWVEPERACPPPQAFGFSGLSPPELPRCWQFVFRAALPVRAPSVLS